MISDQNIKINHMDPYAPNLGHMKKFRNDTAEAQWKGQGQN